MSDHTDDKARLPDVRLIDQAASKPVQAQGLCLSITLCSVVQVTWHTALLITQQALVLRGAALH